ncbi:hypothetical protein [Gorillibacterium sp. sgz5001074]|uniref:hypothetical protein n=1 Tax=Gorillibacterium sp. sgz5001074 TaxID=3446695 RepID=UPI003F66617E
MRFLLTPDGLRPSTDGAIVPELLKRGSEAAGDVVQDTIGQLVITWIQHGTAWLKINGIPIAAEAALLWGLICFLVACSGSGKWLEKGTRAVLMSILLAAARLVGQI